MLEKLLPVGRLLLMAITTTVIVLSFCSGHVTQAAAGRTCVTAAVSHAFRLPDGELHPAGKLTLCRTGTFSPVAQLHLISVNRRPMGMFLSHTRLTESLRTGPPEIVFRRDAEGNLVLIGYTLLTRGKSLAHRLAAPSIAGTSIELEGWNPMPVVAALAR